MSSRGTPHPVVYELTRHRYRQGLTQADVAARMSSSLSHVGALESGLVPNPGIDTVVRYAAALNLDLTVKERLPPDIVESAG